MIWFGLWHINTCRLFNVKSSLYIYIEYIRIWFGWVLWYINHCRSFNAKSSLYIYILNIYDLVWLGFMAYCDGKLTKNPKTGLYFRTCEDGAGWHLIPYRISPRSEFFSQAYKNWHITWGNNLGPDWPPLARGSKFHTITHPPGRFLPSPRQWKIMSL